MEAGRRDHFAKNSFTGRQPVKMQIENFRRANPGNRGARQRIHDQYDPA